MNIVPFAFENHQIRVVTGEDGEPLFVAKDVALALGYVNTNDAISKHCRGVAERYPIVDSLGRTQEARVVREPDLYRLIAGSQLPNAREFEKLIYEEILPSVSRTGYYSAVVQPKNDLLEFQVAEIAARMLRISDTSKIRMLATICEEKGISTKFLPSYSEESLVKSLTALLKEHDSPLTAKAVNLVLLDLGILEEVERVSSHGVKRFKSLTDYGLTYGKNETSPQNPRETQPLYYVSSFSNLLELITKHLED